MRTHLAIPMAAVILAGLFVTGGCVSKAEYDKARAACRRINSELVETQEQLRAAQASKAKYDQRLASLDGGLKSKLQEIDLLEARNSDLQKSFDEMAALYRKSLGTPLPQHPGTPLPAPVDNALQGFAQDNLQLVEYLPKYGMVKFKADFTFEKGQDDVSPKAVEALGKLTKILNSAAASNFHIYVAGHTDDIPIKKPATLRRHPTNWYLSAHRAVEVQKVLTKAGLEPSRIGVIGFGEYHPVEPNKPKNKGNAKNRRVEIWIVPPDRYLTQPSELAAE